MTAVEQAQAALDAWDQAHQLQPTDPGMQSCSVEGCDRTGKMRVSMCSAHYQRWKKYGQTFPERPLRTVSATPEESFAAHTERHGKCLLWTAYLNPDGYGQISVDGHRVLTHRYAWEKANGPVPAGKYLDHICHNRACCNVAHLRLATTEQNGWNRAGAKSGRKQPLPRGVYQSGKRFMTQVMKSGVKYCLGTYATVEEADAVVTAKRAELFGNFAGRG